MAVESPITRGLAGVVVETLPITHSDNRRSFVEFFDSLEGKYSMRGVKVMNIKKPPKDGEIVVGGHWEKAREVIYVLSGRIDNLRVADVETQEEKDIGPIPAGRRIMLPPNIAHRLTFIEEAVLIVLNEAPFSPAKLKPYPFKD